MFGKEKARWLVLRTPEMGVICGTGFLVLVFCIGTHGLWFAPINLTMVLRVTAQFGIVTVGQALLIITGEFDLSVGSVYAFAGVLFVVLARYVGVVPSFLIVLPVTAFIGFMNGLITLKLRVSSFIATLGTLFIFRGLVYFVTGGFGISLPAGVRDAPLVGLLGGKFFAGLDKVFFWFICVVVIFTIVLTRTRYGNRVFAVGGDPLSAFSRGVSPVKTKWMAFVICSTLTGFSGMATVSSMGAAHPTLGTGMELQTIASSVVGGVPLTGGMGTLWGPAIGAFLFTTMRTGLIMMGAPAYWFITFVGIVLIMAVAINTLFFGRRRY